MKLRVLIVEDSPERQDILCKLFKHHAWMLVHTAERAITLVSAYDFDLISLDYDLATEGTGVDIAQAIIQSRNAETKVIIHSMNSVGAERIARILPTAVIVPISAMVRSNAVFTRLRAELSKGTPIDWSKVLSRKGDRGEDHRDDDSSA
jgi:CheY-like chemotaxis protein